MSRHLTLSVQYSAMQKYHFILLIVDTIALAKAKSYFLVRSVLFEVCATALDAGKLSEKATVRV